MYDVRIWDFAYLEVALWSLCHTGCLLLL